MTFGGIFVIIVSIIEVIGTVDEVHLGSDWLGLCWEVLAGMVDLVASFFGGSENWDGCRRKLMGRI